MEQGEFFGIVGRNGSGKSTLLKILAGIYQPTKGRVVTRGRLVPFIELGVGFNPELTGRENVYLNGAMLGFSEKEVAAMYDEIVAFAELEKFMDQRLKNYSSGMQVRLAFAMAVRADADILLVDEVLAVGDADFQRKCYDYFKLLKKNKKTVIFVSHDMEAVRQYCDRAALIDKSKIVDIDTADKISVHYNQLFIKETTTTLHGDVGPSGESRWGSGSAKWRTVKSVIDKEESQIRIIAKGVANEDIENPIFGFSIKNEDFKQILGTNTVRINKKISALKKDQTFEIVWHVDNILKNGQYYIDCTIAQDMATVVCDRWPDAASFTISSREKSPYLVLPNVSYEDNIKGL